MDEHFQFIEKPDSSIVNPLCELETPPKITYNDILRARYRLRTKKTPIIRSNISDAIPLEIFIKQEYMQPNSTFCDRTAKYILMSMNERELASGLITACFDNFGVSLSFYALLKSIPLTIVVPVHTNLSRVKKYRKFGAKVVFHGSDYIEAYHHAKYLSQEKGFTYISRYDNPTFIAAAGVIGLEICEQLKDIDVILVPCGAGEMLTGIAIAVKEFHPEITVIGVQHHRALSFVRSLKTGYPIHSALTKDLVSEDIVIQASCVAVHNSISKVDRMIEVSGEMMHTAVMYLATYDKIALETVGAVTIAACFTEKIKEYKGKRIVAVCTEANVEISSFLVSINRGLVTIGRRSAFYVTLSDEPQQLAQFFRIVDDCSCKVETFCGDNYISRSLFVDGYYVVVETEDWRNLALLKKRLTEKRIHTSQFNIPKATYLWRY